MVFERFNSIFWRWKPLTTNFFLDIRNKNKSLGTKSGLYGEWTINSMVTARIVVVNNDSSSLVRFSIFSKDFGQTNCGVPLSIDRPAMLKCQQSPHAQFCRRNRRRSASKCYFHEQLLSDLARLRRPARWTVSLFRAHVLSVHARHQCSLIQRLILDDLHGARLLATVVHNWIHETSRSLCYRMVVYRKSKI